MKRSRNPIAMLRGAYHSQGRIDQGVERLAERVRQIEQALESLSSRLGPVAEELGAVGERLGPIADEVSTVDQRLRQLEADVWRLGEIARARASDERPNRARLEELRADRDYELAWTESCPLISVTMASLGRDELTELALPSILGQTYPDLEVIVVVDGPQPLVEERVRALADERVRLIDLGPRTPYTEDPRKGWLAGPTLARHAAIRAARGRWLTMFDDDDEVRPECLELLLELAREERAEAVYGQVRSHQVDDWTDVCEFPPRLGHFTWAGGMHHAGLDFFGPEFTAGELGLPSDWWLAERMLRAGVRFAMREEILADIYPSPGSAL